MVEVSLAEVLTEYEDPAACDEALTLLNARLERGSFFNSDLFRWHIALVRLAGHLGDSQTQSRSAKEALVLAGRGPQLPRHPNVGVVEADAETLGWLEGLAH